MLTQRRKSELWGSAGVGGDPEAWGGGEMAARAEVRAEGGLQGRPTL